MTEQQFDSNNAVPATPPAATTLDTEPTSTTPPGATRQWLVGAVLVTAGMVAGSGPTYPLTAKASPAQGQFSDTQGGPGYGRMAGGPRDGIGGPPGTTDGTDPQQGTAPTTAPSGAPSTQDG